MCGCVMGSGAMMGKGAGGVLLTTLFGATIMQDSPTLMDDLRLPIVPVNMDSAILSDWLSESIDSYKDDEPLDGECRFFNFSNSHTSEFCDTFTISRMQSSTIATATSRALKCAAKYGAECVLSSEIGLAVPAVFLARQGQAEMKVLIAPRRVPTPLGEPIASLKHVRVSVPTDTFGSTTLVFNDSLRVEYLTYDKRVTTEKFSGEEAFCVSLLRVAFENECWDKLDGI